MNDAHSESHSQRRWWERLFGAEAPTDRIAQRGLAAEVAALDHELAELRAAAAQSVSAADLRADLAAVEKQVARAGREQLRASSASEALAEELRGVLARLRADDERREGELAATQARHAADLTATRLEHAQSLLPALDAIDEALRAGRRLLASAAQQPPVAAPASGWLARLLGEPPPDPAHAAAYHEVATLRSALAAWLDGQEFVRRRLLDVLAQADVRPLAAAGQPFDPHMHIAMGTAPVGPDHPPGTVVEELRRGYSVGTRLLRSAEVVVAAEA